MAAATTFSIPELLESILLLAAPKTVLLAQRVNKTFRATIKGSEKLQVKLFFKQKASPPVILQAPICYLVEDNRTVTPTELDYQPFLDSIHKKPSFPNVILLEGRMSDSHVLRRGTRWVIDCAPLDLPDESSALDMYPNSVPDVEHWRKFGSLPYRYLFARTARTRVGEDQTLRQFLSLGARAVNTRKGSDSYNTLILDFTEADPSPRWALRRHAQDLPSESSALDMYPCSVPGELYWGNLVWLKLRSGDRPQKWFLEDVDETLHQFFRGLAWTRKSRKELNYTGKGIRKNKAVRFGRQGILEMSIESRTRA
ncbi:hypothetical protein LTR95_001939 [Oleoguttula sp. CCFEE 5521]